MLRSVVSHGKRNPTTIDTAVTAVDSLAIDGDVNVGAAISAADYEGNLL